MTDQKKYWCFTCNSECQINIIKQDDEEEYQCSKCKNTFIEEILQEDNPSDFHVQQPTQSQNIPQHINNLNNLDGINITITNIKIQIIKIMKMRQNLIMNVVWMELFYFYLQLFIIEKENLIEIEL